MATARAWGSSSRVNSSRFAAISAAMRLAPVRFAPGRPRLATRPLQTGVRTTSEDNRDGCGRFLRSPRRNGAAGYDHGDLTADQISGQSGQAVVVTIRPAVVYRDVLALNVARFLKTALSRFRDMCECVG